MQGAEGRKGKKNTKHNRQLAQFGRQPSEFIAAWVKYILFPPLTPAFLAIVPRATGDMCGAGWKQAAGGSSGCPDSPTAGRRVYRDCEVMRSDVFDRSSPSSRHAPSRSGTLARRTAPRLSPRTVPEGLASRLAASRRPRARRPAKPRGPVRWPRAPPPRSRGGSRCRAPAPRTGSEGGEILHVLPFRDGHEVTVPFGAFEPGQIGHELVSEGRAIHP